MLSHFITVSSTPQGVVCKVRTFQAKLIQHGSTLPCVIAIYEVKMETIFVMFSFKKFSSHVSDFLCSICDALQQKREQVA